MTKKAFRPLSPHERVEQIFETIALLPEAQQPVVLAEACDLLESPQNTQPLPKRIETIEFLAVFAECDSAIEKRLQKLWEKTNIDYAGQGDRAKRAVKQNMNREIREKGSRFALSATNVYCIVTYGHPRDLWDRMKAFGRRAVANDPQPTQ